MTKKEIEIKRYSQRERFEDVLHHYTQWGLGTLGAVFLGIFLSNDISKEIQGKLNADTSFFFFIFFAAVMFFASIVFRIVRGGGYVQFWDKRYSECRNKDPNEDYYQDVPNENWIYIQMLIVIGGYICLLNAGMIFARIINVPSAMLIALVYAVLFVVVMIKEACSGSSVLWWVGTALGTILLLGALCSLCKIQIE